jgi:hypothetical protein
MRKEKREREKRETARDVERKEKEKLLFSWYRFSRSALPK